MCSTVGWNWTNSRSLTRAPARQAMARPSPVAIAGFVVSRYTRPAPPVARRTARASIRATPPSWRNSSTPAQRPPSMTSRVANA